MEGKIKPMVKKKIDALIFVEHIVREMDTAVFLKHLLEKEGFSVEVTTIRFNKERIIFEYTPKFIFVPWAYSDNEMKLFKHFNYNEKQKFVIINFHHEQVTSEKSLRFIMPEGEAKNIYHISWGNEFTKLLQEYNCNKNTILEVGNPRLDFYSGWLRNISKSRADLANENGLDPNKKWVLFVANSFHLHSEEQIEHYEKKGVEVRGIGSIGKKNTYKFYEYCDMYLKENKNVEIIYRPHPSMANLEEDNEKLQEILSKYKNCHFIFKDSLRDWILSSDLILSFHSTSIIECVKANKPFFLFRPHKLNPELDLEIFKKSTNKIETYNSFYEVLNKKNYDLDTNVISAIQHTNILDDKKYASEKIVDIILEMNRDLDSYIIKYKTNILTYLYLYFKYTSKKLLFKTSRNVRTIGKVLEKSKDHRIYNILGIGHDVFTQKDIQKVYDKVIAAEQKN